MMVFYGDFCNRKCYDIRCDIAYDFSKIFIAKEVRKKYSQKIFSELENRAFVVNPKIAVL